MDEGPWEVKEDGCQVWIESDDFKHDVSLQLYGDFKDWDERTRYANWIAKALNGASKGKEEG